MKFSLGFSALALAADHEAPVISLDLSHMICSSPDNCPNTSTFGDFNLGHNLAATQAQAFADECEVTQNSGNCEEPVASAVDHHDSAVNVVTSYTLFVKADVKKDVEKCQSLTGEQCFTTNVYSASIDTNLRSEYIIKYTAEDASGNAADTLTFALIIRDQIAPVCHSASPSPGCVSNGVIGYRSHSNGDIEIEYCDDARSPETIVWGPVPMAYDAVDGILSKSDSAASFSLSGGTISWFNDEPSILNTGYVQSGPNIYDGQSFKGLQMEYTVSFEDYASVFGATNINNKKEESGILSLTDTTSPVIDSFSSPESFYECKSAFLRPVLGYTDCFDDWALTKGRAKSVITVTFSGDANNAQPYINGSIDGDGNLLGVTADCERASDSPCTINIEYNVTDHHGNQATETGSWLSYDSLKPTLRITMLTDASSVQTNAEGDICAGTGVKAPLAYNTSVIGAQDMHAGWCETPVHAGNFKTFMHTSPTDVTQYDPILDSAEISHSAGTHDYTVISDLTSNNHWECEDLCSATADLTSSAVWSDDCVNSGGTPWDNNVIGTYHILYKCSDVAGNMISACRTIINQDVSKPLITVLSAADSANGHLHEEASLSRNYVDYGATCTDVVDGDISDLVEVSGDVVNLSTLGTYRITYECTDSSNNVATPGYRTIVVADRTCPFCSSDQTVADVTVEASFPYTEHDVLCTDTFEGELVNRKTCVGNCLNSLDVDVEHTGTYAMIWSATDSSGNGQSAIDNDRVRDNVLGVPCNYDEIAVTVTVKDTKSPSIELTYKSNVIHARHQTTLMEETSSVNGWTIGAVASAVSGVALLGYAATRRSNVATSVPV